MLDHRLVRRCAKIECSGIRLAMCAHGPMYFVASRSAKRSLQRPHLGNPLEGLVRQPYRATLSVDRKCSITVMAVSIDPECGASTSDLERTGGGAAINTAETRAAKGGRRPWLQILNFRRELFASTFSFGATAVIRLGSSLVLTRLLSPDAYGIFGILLSFLFMIEMMSDVGTMALLIRHPRGDEPRFVHTLWTIRLIRSVFNFAVVFLAAPLIASIYHAPALKDALRVLSIWFLLNGAESMSFGLAIRHQRARLSNYNELASNVVMTMFVIGMAFLLRNHFALILGALLQRVLLVVASHFYYRDIGVGIAFDREARRDQFQFARYVTPSSVLTIVLAQYDKVILARLFNLTLLGIYSIAGNMVAQLTGVMMHNARFVLFARCADYFRSNRSTAAYRYYRENVRLFAIGALPSAIIAGFAPLIIAVLYDPRYMMAGRILTVMGLSAVIAAFQNASENLLVASGLSRVVLVANIIRIVSLIPAVILGYHFFGFEGFIWCTTAATLPPLLYFYWEQWRSRLLEPLRELTGLGLCAVVFLISLGLSHVLQGIVPAGWLHLGWGHHHAHG
jgi:lipopolysaccharide exporter